MKKVSVIVVLLLATLVFTGGCVSSDDTPYNPSQSGGSIVEEENLILTKTFTMDLESGVVTITTNELMRTATAIAEYSPAYNFASPFAFELTAAMIVSMLVDPIGFMDGMTEMQQQFGGTIKPEVESLLYTLSGYTIQSVTISGYVNGQYVSLTAPN